MSNPAVRLYNKMPRFVWGCASEFHDDGRDWLIHTQYPRFICEVTESLDPICNVSDKRLLAFGYLRFTNAIFLDRPPVDLEKFDITPVLKSAVADWKLYNNDIDVPPFEQELK